MSRRRSRSSASSSGARQPRNRATRDHKGPYRTLLRRSDVDGSKALPRLVMASGVIGGAFALGLLFGDHAISDGPSALDGGLAKIDELTGEYEQVRDQLQLTFHKELTEAQKEAQLAVEASRTRRGQVASGLNDALPVLSATDNPLQNEPDDEKAEKGHADPANKTSPAVSPTTKPSAAAPAAKTAQMTEPAPAEELDDVGEDDDAAKTPAVVAGSRKRLASALSSLLGEETPDWAQKLSTAPKKHAQMESGPAKAAGAAAPTTRGASPAGTSAHGAAPKTVAKAPAKGSYYLQVASSPSADGADRLRAKLAADGHRASVMTADVGGRTMHRVVIVGFSDKDAAGRARDRVASAHGLKGLVRESR